jgi:hypothetical protein
MTREFKIPTPSAKDWNNLFWALAEQVRDHPCIIVFDEINWMGDKDPTFLGKLKSAWDRDFSLFEGCLLILSGSLAGWIDRNILQSTGFLGRVSLDMTLKELPLKACRHFWGDRASYISSYEIIRTLLVTGGVPKYLEEINPKRSANENIKNLCFDSGGLLYREFDQIFNDQYSDKSSLYREIIEVLAEQPLEYSQLPGELGLEYQSGTLAPIIEDLEKSGFIRRDYTWSIQKACESRLSRLRLHDNYIRFYLKGVSKYKSRIQKGALEKLPEIESLLGLQFENLVLANYRSIWESLSIDSSDIVMDNPFFQRKTQRLAGCQIDYLIQTKQNTLYLCEIKFSKNPIKSKVINEVKEKILKMKVPKHYSIRPVLIHAHSVEQRIIDEDFFDYIIDISEELNK